MAKQNRISNRQRLDQMRIYLADLKANKGKRKKVQPEWLKQILSKNER